jgi:hypothetical protein
MEAPNVRIHYANQIFSGQNPLSPTNVNNADFPSSLPVHPIGPNMSVSDTDFLISSTEDIGVDEWSRMFRFAGVATYEGIVIRDPFNQLASRMKLFDDFGILWGMEKSAFIGGFAALWMGHLRRALRDDPDTMFVDYNEWFDSEAYRRSICERWGDRWGLTFDDKYLNVVTDHGKGSSFDARAFDGRGQGMRVHARWETFKNTPEFWDALASGGIDFVTLLEDYYRRTTYLREPIDLLARRVTHR